MASSISRKDIWLIASGFAALFAAWLLFYSAEPEFYLSEGVSKSDIEHYILEDAEQLLGFSEPISTKPQLIRTTQTLSTWVKQHGKRSLKQKLANSEDTHFFYVWEADLFQVVPGPETLPDTTLEDESERSAELEVSGSGLSIFWALNDEVPSKLGTVRYSLKGQLISFEKETDAGLTTNSDGELTQPGSDISNLSLHAKRLRAANQILSGSIWSYYEPELLDQESNGNSGAEESIKKFTYQLANTPVDDAKLTIQFENEFSDRIQSLSYTGSLDFAKDTPLAIRIFNAIVDKVLPTLLFLIIIFLFFSRHFNHLIDFKIPRIDAMLFGLIFSLMISLQLFGTEFLGRMHFLAATGLSLLIFLVVWVAMSLLMLGVLATAESLLQEAWQEKSRTMGLIRHGLFSNRLVGQSVTRGFIAGLFMVFITMLLYFSFDKIMLPNIDIREVQLIETAFFYEFHSLAIPAITSIYIVFFSICIPASWLKLRKAPDWLITILVTILASFFAISLAESPGVLDNHLVRFAVVLIPVLLFLYYDVLTSLSAFITFYGASVMFSGFASPGWSDITVILTGAGLLISIFALGFTGLRKPEADFTIPDLQPEYLKKLAREQRIEKELELAREVHQTLLSSSRPILNGYDIATTCRTAYEVGGDYYDFIPLDEDKTLIVIADVSGKGVKAAFYMTLLKGYLQSVALQKKEIQDIVVTVNSLFHANTPKGTFITAIAGVLDTSDHSFTFVRAGHDPLFHIPAGSGEPQTIQPNGFALGMTGEPRFSNFLKTETLSINRGDYLVLYTDGYPESFNYNRKQLGDSNFREIVTKNAHSSSLAVDLVERTHRSVQSFTAGAQQHDDMTMIVILRKAEEQAKPEKPELENSLAEVD
ncbi:MAG: SpoIIE family protein phosphatase [Balneolales bacterium]|nr:SpoIIE family protein phosphatase [Balneolales bacterium]